MGSSSSKFKKYLQHGDEYAAMQVYQSSPELRRGLEPNYSYGDHHAHNTPLHYASRHGMKHLIRAFLNDLDGDPNRRNAFGQTSLHCVCNVSRQKSPNALERRAYSVILLLSWRGPVRPSTGERERVEVNARDDFGYTALHYGAQSGLRKCIEYLLAHGADPFAETRNSKQEGLTPCDLAVSGQNHHVAQLLESRMVFSGGTPESMLSGDSGSRPRASSFDGGEEDEEEVVYSGLRSQDLQEAKDQLIVETADTLHVPLFTAEALLRHAEWSRENLLEEWLRDPVQTCQRAGVRPPYSSLGMGNSQNEERGQQEARAVGSAAMALYEKQMQHNRHQPQEIEAPPPPPPKPKIHSENSFVVDEELAEDGHLCELCCDLLSPDGSSDNGEMTCGHRFCSNCWKNYLHTKIKEGDPRHIVCPAFECEINVPEKVIENHVTPEMARRYLKFDIDAFVETNKDIRWCPVPSCQRAVNLPQSEKDAVSQVSHSVDCGAGHFFCWECGHEAHAPVMCGLWKLWLTRCGNVDPAKLTCGSGAPESPATKNCLWLITHSRPCPNCQSPTQKSEGCNHIRCAQCSHDFCWVCLDSWKKHASASANGGYSRCNRYVEDSRRWRRSSSSLNRMPEQMRATRDLNCFAHFYSRYRNHENSRLMEEPLMHSAKRKREILQSSLSLGEQQDQDALSRNTKFYEDGVWELLKARRILCGSYAYGFYLATAMAEEEEEAEDNSNINDMLHTKAVFDLLQSELEQAAECLSEIIGRPYLRTPRRVIIEIMGICRRKRHEFLKACYRGLEETPPPPPPHQNIQVSQTTTKPVMNNMSTSPATPIPLDELPSSLPPIPSQHYAHQSSMNIGAGVDVDRNRLVESISDHLYGRGNLWARDEVETTAAIQCPSCRRTSCTAIRGTCGGGTRDYSQEFNSLRREAKPQQPQQPQPQQHYMHPSSYPSYPMPFNYLAHQLPQHHRHMRPPPPPPVRRSSQNSMGQPLPPAAVPIIPPSVISHSHSQYYPMYDQPPLQHQQHQLQQPMQQQPPIVTIPSGPSPNPNGDVVRNSRSCHQFQQMDEEPEEEEEEERRQQQQEQQEREAAAAQQQQSVQSETPDSLSPTPSPENVDVTIAVEMNQLKISEDDGLTGLYPGRGERRTSITSVITLPIQTSSRRSSRRSSRVGADDLELSNVHEQLQQVTIKLSVNQDCSSRADTPDTPDSASTLQSASCLRPPRARFHSKSISTDGSECRDLPDYEERTETEEMSVSCTLEVDESDRERSESFVRAANETVSSFLKTLALNEGEQQGSNIAKGDEDDGKFRIGDIHDSGGYSESFSSVDSGLKRSQSTGDMEHQESKEVPTYMDSDFSCSEKPPAEEDCYKHSRSGVSIAENDYSSATLQDVSDTSESTSTAGKLPQPPPPLSQQQPSSKRERVSQKTPTPPPPPAPVERPFSPKSSKPPLLKSQTTAASTFNRANRPRLLRQKSFDIDSDSTDAEGSNDQKGPLRRSWTEKKITTKKDSSCNSEKPAQQAAVFQLRDQHNPIKFPKSATAVKPAKQPNVTTSDVSASHGPSAAAAGTYGNSSSGKALSKIPKQESKAKHDPKKAATLKSQKSHHKCSGALLKQHHTLAGKSISISGKRLSGKKKRPSLTITIDNSSFAEKPSTIITTADGNFLAHSPTLHISGVHVSRSPGGANDKSSNSAEPSPGFGVASASPAVDSVGGRHRSSSLVVPPPTPSRGGCCCKHSSCGKEGSSSPGSRSLHMSDKGSPLCSPRRGPASASHIACASGKKDSGLFTFPPDAAAIASALSSSQPPTSAPPASPLSSVLHIHDANLSSDDFHEALFLQKSPSKSHSKKRRRSRKNKKGPEGGEGVREKSADNENEPSSPAAIASKS